MSKPGKDISKPKKILAIDDDDTILKLYCSILGEEGYDIETASTGKEALKMISQDSFDLVFLDLKLPDISGTDVLKKIREKLEWAPVVVVTANPSLESSIEAIRAGGVYEYIIKPFGADNLKLAIRRALEKNEMMIENKRLMKRLERTNEALSERVDELEKFAKVTMDYEKEISDLKKKIAGVQGNKP